MAPDELERDNPDPERLRQLDERLKQARGRQKTEPTQSPPSNLGVAMRLVTELVAAVIIGLGLGWGLDRLFHTSPLMLLVMFFLGLAAGFRNVIRAAHEMDRNMPPGGTSL